MTQPNENSVDSETSQFLALLDEQEKVRSHRIPGVRTVLVVLSTRGMVFDKESLRQKILISYPDAAVFFRTTSGHAAGVAAPDRVDLLIDFTGPGQIQSLFYSRKLRSMARVAIGRNAGLFRKSIYDKIYDEKAEMKKLPIDLLHRERQIQREVLALAGVPISQTGDPTQDKAHSIALDLPPLKRH